MSQNLNDCYFFYYSSCNKGKECPFRHEPSARGSEETCEEWEFGRCTNPKCSKRHMVITVKRTEIACYWENQPGGCQKAHCVFKHRKDKERVLPCKLSTRDIVNNEDIPSPKIDPVLITTDDTDEESPQKVSRIKPVISQNAKTIKKKISLKGVKSTEEDLMIKKLCKNSDQLEQEIMEQAKKGLAEAQTLGLLHPEEDAPSKSLREWKKEKILRAKLELEKRRQTLAKQQEIEKNKSPDSIRHVVKKDNSITIIKPNLDKRRQLYTNKDSQQTVDITSNESADEKEVIVLEQSSEVTQDPVPIVNLTSDPSSLKIKTLEEIREEKRKRKLEQERHQNAMITEHVNNRSKEPVVSKRAKLTEKQNVERQTESKPSVVIPARKMKITCKVEKSTDNTSNSKPIRLKRTSFVSKDTTEKLLPEVNGTTKESISQINIEHSKIEDELTDTSNKSSVNSKDATQIGTENTEPKSISSPASVELPEPNLGSEDDLEDEFDDDILGNSIYFEKNSQSLSTTAGNSFADDDDLMNEMEELLA